MRILFLDLATSLGWACGEPGAERPLSGWHVIALPNTDVGQFLARYKHWLTDKMRIHQPSHVVYEAPFLAQNTSLETMEKLIGLSGVTQMITWEQDLQSYKADNQDICKWFTGRPRWTAPKQRTKSQQSTANRRLKKEMTMRACVACGWHPENDDEGDALAGWSYAVAQLAPTVKQKRWDGPLLEAR